MTRLEIIDVLAARGVRLGGGFAFRTDADVELALGAWNRHGAPSDVQIDAHSTKGDGLAFSFTGTRLGDRS